MNNKRKINIVTLGCSKNVVDSEKLLRQLQTGGYSVVHDSNDTSAGTVIINTCGFIRDAKEESIDTILEFARANAHANGCPTLKIVDLDWNRPSLEGAFDFIVGSEVVYHERDFEPLQRLFEGLLKPEGEIILAEGIRKSSMEFFARMQGYFHVKGHKKVLRSGGKEMPVILCRMRRLR